MTKPPKKSETLEIRIPHGTKQALMARARAEGRPASEVVRGFIDAYLAETACSPTAWERNMTTLRAYSRPSIALLAAFVSIGGIGFAVSPATALPDLEAAFKELDVDGNGILSADEFGSGKMIRKMVRKARASDPAAPEAATAVPVGPPASDMMFVMRATSAAADARPIMFAVRVPGGGEPAVRSGTSAGIGGAQFATMDLDHDGRLSFSEFEAHHRRLVDQAFGAVDEDKDGFLTVAEIAGANRGGGDAPAVMAAFDRDADGRLSRQEFMAPRE